MPRSIGAITAAQLAAENIDWSYFVKWTDADGTGPFYYTDRPGGFVGNIGALGSQTWVETDVIVGPIPQSVQDFNVVSWIDFSNVDFSWRNRASVIRWSDVLIFVGQFDPAAGTLIDSWKIWQGEADDAILGVRARISLKPEKALWAQRVCWQVPGHTCFNVFKDPLTCQYIGADTSCRHDRDDCTGKLNTLHFNIFDLMPRPGDRLTIGKESWSYGGAS